MSSIATSGTVNQYSFDTRKVIEHACRRAGIAPEMLAPELLEVAQDLLFTLLSEWASVGFPLWTRQFLYLPVSIGGIDVPTSIGTVDVIHAYWRTFSPYRGPATLTSGGDGSILFAGAPNADVTILGPNPGVGVTFVGATEIDTIGVLPGGSTTVTAALQIFSNNVLVKTLPQTTLVPGVWSYFGIDPSLNLAQVSIVNPGASLWTVNQFNLCLSNGQDILIGPLNIDDYYNLPNKLFQADRATSAFVDRQFSQPVIKIWPTISVGGFYTGTVTALTRRYIQDPGSLTNQLEVPARGLEAVIWRLASRMIYELPDPSSSSQASYFTTMGRQQRIQAIEANATKAEAIFWAEERSKGPIRILPRIGVYNR